MVRRQVGRVVVAAVVSAVAAGSAAWSATYSKPPEAAEPGPTLKMPGVVQARAFELVDKSGMVRGGLAQEEDGAPFLYLTDPKGNTRASLFLYNNFQPKMVFYGKDGQGYRDLDHSAWVEKDE